MRKILAALVLAPTLLLAQEEAPKMTPTVGDTRDFPAPRLVEGQPWDARPTEWTGDHPLLPHQTRAPYHHATDFQVTTLTDKLHLPWSLAFLPDGKMLVSEKFPGHIRILSADGTLGEPLKGIDMLAPAKKLGVLDVVLAPDFAKSKRVYFTFYEIMPDRNGNTNLAYGTLDEAANALHDVAVIFRGKPYESVKNFSSKQGGRIAFAKDGTIFLAMGDRDGNRVEDYQLALAQKLDNHMGKILHLLPDGQPAPNNPFLKTPGALPEIWTYGMRSPQGLAFAPDGKLWETEHGPRGGDELNLIQRGKNYGWPTISHGWDYPGKPILDGLIEKPGMEQPVYYWDPVIAPGSLAFYRGNLFPAWRHSAFVAGLRGIGVYRLEMKAGKVVAEEPMLNDLKQRIRDTRVGPDGALYVVTEQKAVLKVTPK
jgi:glucose/arabinose dehydrogenase